MLDVRDMKVSIITVCYNSAATIRDTIESVLGQSYPDLEYLIIDGNSSDDTLSIVNDYEDRISTIVSEPDKGMYDGLNKGIQLASGDLIGMLNADDFYVDKQVISEVVDLIQAENTEALYADLQYVAAEDVSQIKRHWKSGTYKKGDFIKGWMPPHPTFFIKKSCYLEYGGFNPNLKSAADYELMLRMLHKHKVSVSYLPKVIVKMRTGGMSNRSLRNRLRANREDKRAWEINGLKASPFTFLFKPLRKLRQFV